MAHPDPLPYELELTAVRFVQARRRADRGGQRLGAVGRLGRAALDGGRQHGCVGWSSTAWCATSARCGDMASSSTRAAGARWTARTVSGDRSGRAGELVGVRIQPGDLIVVDEDGIAVVPAAVEAAVVQRAWDKVHAENQVRDAIRGGMSATAAFAKFGVL